MKCVDVTYQILGHEHIKVFWYDIPGYSRYQVSSSGKVRSVDRVVLDKGSVVTRIKSKQISPTYLKDGSIKYRIYNDANVRKTVDLKDLIKLSLKD